MGAFVTCGFTTEEVSLNVQSFMTRITNHNATEVTVGCTAVVGDELVSPVYLPKSVTVAPGATASLNWTSAESASLLVTDSVALSCMLPPMTSLNRNRITTLLSLL